MTEWIEYKLKDVADVTMGQSPKSEFYNTEEKGKPFLQGNRTFGRRFPTFDTWTTKTTKEAKAGDVIMSVRAPVGDLNITLVDMCLGRGVCGIRMKNGKQDFLYYLMEYSIPQLLNLESGTIFGSVNKNDINELRVLVPDEETQDKVTAFLKNIDDKIEMNEAVNRNLEQQLHILFIQIFNSINADVILGDVVETTSGGTPSRKHTEYYENGSICWVKSKELLGNYILDTEEHINDMALSKSSAKLLPRHSVLIAMYGATVGAHGIISKSMTCNQAVCALLCNEKYPYTYLFQIAQEQQQKLINMAVGSAQQNISQILIKQLPLHSDISAIRKFHDLAFPLHKQIEELQAENRILSEMRDTLLPQLMSGRLDVSDIDL